MSDDWTSFKQWFAIGAAVLLMGLLFQWYPSSVISGMRERLTQKNITPDEVTVTQENLNTWQIWQISSFQPVSLALFTAGILILIYSVLSAMFSIASSYAHSKKQEKE